MDRRIALVVNDDGIESEGLRVMAKVSATLWDTYIVAPKEERSGVGKAITLGAIAVEECEVLSGVQSYAIGGTPADAVLLGMDYLLPRDPDIVLSGINLGPNLGIEDYLDSGTLGAALEASIHGIPSVAASLCISKSDKLKGEYDLQRAELLLRALFRVMDSENHLAQGQIVAVNIPHPVFLGVSPCSISPRAMRKVHDKVGEGYAMKSWEMSLYGEGEPGTDIHAVVRERKASICVTTLELKSRYDLASSLSERLKLEASDKP